MSANTKRILILEDDPDIRCLLELALQGEGYEVRVATNGREGLEAIRRRVPDLILLDMGMPVMDGRAFAKELRRRYGSEVPVIVLSAAGYDRRIALEVHAIKWLGKPFDLDTLLQFVAQTTARGRRISSN